MESEGELIQSCFVEGMEEQVEVLPQGNVGSTCSIVVVVKCRIRVGFEEILIVLVAFRESVREKTSINGTAVLTL